MNKRVITLVNILITFVSLLIIGCSGSSEHAKNNEYSDTASFNNKEDIAERFNIIKTALTERENRMYSPSEDTTYLYWLDNYPMIIKNTSKCNIFALNTLYKAGFKTPNVNALSKDLFNESNFQDIMPVVSLSSLDDILVGDLIIWKSHVIIFESLAYVKNKPYAFGIWAGTSQKDNGKTVINNVNYSKYPLKGDFKVRRPVKINKDSGKESEN